MSRKVCPKCDSLILNAFCIKCGFNAESLDDDSSTIKSEKILHTANHQSKHSKIKVVTSVKDEEETSILQKIIRESNITSLDDVIIENTSRLLDHKFSLSALLVSLTFVFLLYFYLLQINKPNYLSPVIVNEIAQLKNKVTDLANDIKNQGDDNSDLYTFVYKSEFPEANLNNKMLYNFVPPKNQAILHISDFRSYYKDFLSGSSYKEVLKDFDIKEDDVKVYFTNGFLLTFSEDSLDQFGFITEVKDKNFIDKKLEVYNKKYLASTKNDPKAKNVVSPKSGYLYNRVVELKNEGDKESNYFLLISNSKDYLDELKESSEGNLKNLNNDAVFHDVKSKLNITGHLFVYKKDKESLWPKIVTKIFEKYHNDDLLKYLSKAKSKGLVVYSKDGKMNIQTQD